MRVDFIKIHLSLYVCVYGFVYERESNGEYNKPREPESENVNNSVCVWKSV